MIQPEADGLTVVSSRDPERLADLRGEWKALHDAAALSSPFLAWEWLFPWWRAFGARRAVWILEARERDARLSGLLVLSARPSSMGIRRWQLLGNGVTGADALDVLALPGRAAPVRAALARAIADQLDRWDLIDLEDVPCGSPTIAALRRALAPRGAHVQVERRFVCPGFAVRGTFPGHLARVRRRETYRRRARWLARRPGFHIEVAAAPEDAPPAMDDFLRLHRLRWEAEGGSWGIPPGVTEEFHREVAPLLAARGWLRLYRLFVDDASIAAVYGIEMRRRFFYYQSGYDPAWSARSPGLVLAGRTIEDAYARGLDDYDFLRGTEPYKLDWAWDRRETCAVRIRAPSLRAGTAAAAGEAFRAARGLARAVAPERVWDALRRARRRFHVDALAGAD